MADSVKKAKAIRISKLGAFTRKKNHLAQLLDGGADSAKLKDVYADLTLFGAGRGGFRPPHDFFDRSTLKDRKSGGHGVSKSKLLYWEDT